MIEPPRGDDAARLSALAAGLCQDAGIAVEVRDGTWAWDPARRVIRVSRETLARHGSAYCAGVLAAEVGHVFLSRYHLFAIDFPSRLAAERVVHALEAPRVGMWMNRRYPGTTRWMAAVRDHHAAFREGEPEFVTFCREVALEWLRHWEPAGYGLPVRVVEALAQTRRARQLYSQTVPSPDVDTSVAAGVAADYRSRVWPNLLVPRPIPAGSEQLAQLRAFDALKLAEEDILPWASWLIGGDLERLRAYLRADAGASGRAREALRLSAVRSLFDAIARAAGARLPPLPAGLEALALELIEAYLRELAKDGAPGPLAPVVFRVSGVPARRAPVRRGDRVPMLPPHALPPLRPGWTSPSAYDREYERVASQVDELTAHLEAILRPRRRLRGRSGYPSGRRVDLRKLMVFDADPRRYGELWIRNTIPDRRRVAMSLLVDLSGSMSGEAAQSALLGTVLMAETLARLDVDFAINGFQDKLIRFCGFGEHYTEQTRGAVAEMVLEVEGCRPSGNNTPGYNDDGPCLLEAAHELLDHPAADRLLVVVSDGCPAGCRSDDQDLHDAVAELTAASVPMQLIGLGLGPGTEHVREFYPESVANVPLSDFSREIGALVERMLLS